MEEALDAPDAKIYDLLKKSVCLTFLGELLAPNNEGYSEGYNKMCQDSQNNRKESPLALSLTLFFFSLSHQS